MLEGQRRPRAGRLPRRILARAGGVSRVLNRRESIMPLVGLVRFGSLRRLTPVSRHYGFDRGLPIDRHYIEDFLGRFASRSGYSPGDIRGRVLEVGDGYYSRKFGIFEQDGPGTISKLDILHVSAANHEATIVGDLATGVGIPSDVFDCVICTQTLHVIYDFRAAISSLHRMLRPGGVVLVTVPGICGRCKPDYDHWGDWWRFTTLSARRLFEEVFDPQAVTVEAYGNVKSAISFLHGIAAEELTPGHLAARDPDYEVLIAIRAVKSDASETPP